MKYLHTTKKLFELWHVFHLPLVYLMFVIVAAHVAITLYLGYVPFRW
jgi:cytochrome b561